LNYSVEQNSGTYDFEAAATAVKGGRQRLETLAGDVDHTPRFAAAFLNQKGVAVKQHVRGISIGSLTDAPTKVWRWCHSE
jgi:hypothetical protein